MPKDTLSIVDNRTGQSFEVPIHDNCINATHFLQMKSTDGQVTRIFDPAYMNTINCISHVSYIDGDKGVLEYRGYPIE